MSIYGPLSMLAVLLILALCICYLVAWIFTMQLVTRAANAKGYTDINGKLWFIGLFGLIVTPAIIVAALPDKSNNTPTVTTVNNSGPAQFSYNDLPEL